jgi:hypothetical protein
MGSRFAAVVVLVVVAADQRQIISRKKHKNKQSATNVYFRKLLLSFNGIIIICNIICAMK